MSIRNAYDIRQHQSLKVSWTDASSICPGRMNWTAHCSQVLKTYILPQQVNLRSGVRTGTLWYWFVPRISAWFKVKALVFNKLSKLSQNCTDVCLQTPAVPVLFSSKWSRVLVLWEDQSNCSTELHSRLTAAIDGWKTVVPSVCVAAVPSTTVRWGYCYSAATTSLCFCAMSHATLRLDYH